MSENYEDNLGAFARVLSGNDHQHQKMTHREDVNGGPEHERRLYHLRSCGRCRELGRVIHLR